jgi:hypothetical protein
MEAFRNIKTHWVSMEQSSTECEFHDEYFSSINFSYVSKQVVIVQESLSNSNISFFAGGPQSSAGSLESNSTSRRK